MEEWRHPASELVPLLVFALQHHLREEEEEIVRGGRYTRQPLGGASGWNSRLTGGTVVNHRLVQYSNSVLMTSQREDYKVCDF